jgi:hypothetical protein
MQCINTELLYPTAYLLGLLQCIASFLPECNRVVVIDSANFHLQMKITADLLTYRFDDIQQKARSILQRSPIFIVAIVDA